MSGVEVKGDDLFNFYTPKKDSQLALLQELRMADVYLKMKYQSLGKLVYDKLVSGFSDRPAHFDVGAGKHREVGELYVGYGMSRAMGLMEVVYVIKEGLFLTIQIQGNYYRQMVQGYAGYGSASKEYAQHLKDQNEWFDFSHIYKHPTEYPKRKGKTFNKYGETDFYRSVKLKATFSVEEVVKFVLEDLERILNISKI
jgi:hypothetical protein